MFAFPNFNPSSQLSKRNLFFLLAVFAIVGYFARPWIDELIPGQMEKGIPELSSIYEPSIQLDNTIRNPVVVIPGMMGSKLHDRSSDRLVWGVFDSQSIDPDVPADVRLLACPIDGADLDQFDDGVEAAGVLASMKIKFIGLSITSHAYWNILQMLGVGGYRDEELGEAGEIDYGNKHYTCFQFAYDWRRDNAETARRLHTFLLEKKAYVEAERKRRFGIDAPVKFDIVAHSMGGVVARYYLRYGDQGSVNAQQTPELDWSGCELVDRVILIGAPGNGATKSLVSTHEGFLFSPAVKPFPSGLVATLPSIYQMLPHGPEPAVFDEETGKPLDHFDVDTWDRRGWGLLNPDQDYVLKQLLPDVKTAGERRQIAKAHVAECLSRAVGFQRALNVPGVPDGTTIHLFAGDAIPTVDTVNSNLEERTLTTRSTVPGDGTVARKSALADKRNFTNWTPALQSPIHFSDVRFMFDDHFGLTRDAEFTDNALYLLLEDPTKSSPTRVVK